MKRKRTASENEGNYVKVGDLSFETGYPGADYNLRYTSEMTDRKLINGTACLESTIVFAAREG